ncbi:transposase [Rhodobium orientis]|nr:transposase [Rhodobium orientis]MBB4301834.1 transposase [Rhodobium orientis]
MRRLEATDGEWGVIEPLLPRNSRGAARVDDRRAMDGIRWRLRAGSSRRDGAERCGRRTTLYNRFSRWGAVFRIALWRRSLRPMTVTSS